jgi:hypothetical protein
MKRFPHPSNRTPINLRMRCTELLGQILHGFPDDFQAAHKGTPQRLIRCETLEAQTLTLIEQGFNFYENMAQIVTRLEGHPLPQPGCAAR